MYKRLFLSLAMVWVLWLSACSPAGGSGKYTPPEVDLVSEMEGTVRIALAGWQLENGIDALTGEESIGFNQYVEQVFQKMYPNITLEVTQIPWENVRAKQQAMLLSNDVDLLYTGGAFAYQFYQQGLLRDIDDLIEGDPAFDPSIYLEGLWENAYSARSPDKTKQFGIPTVLGKRMIVYDKKIFDDWGVEYLTENPTPEEVLEKAKQMTGTNPVTGEQNYGLWFSGNSLNQSTFVALTYAYGAKGGEGTLADLGEIEWQINTSEMAKVFEWLAEAAQLAPPAFVNGQGAENFGLENNNIAIAIDSTGGAAFSEYRSGGNTELIERFVPVLNFGPNGEGWVATDPIIMAKNVQNVEAAWEVMKFLAGYETQSWNYQNFLGTPTLKEADFVDPNDIYTAKAMEIAAMADPTLMDEANPYYSSEMVPAINGFISQAANGNPPEIAGFLERLQQEAESWSAGQ
jgi:multiple sugar transport system substrate-binding protein